MATKARELLDALAPDERDLLRDEEVPSWTAPMLATLTDERFSDPDWIYERKLDGERVLAFRDGRTVRLLSRNRKALNDAYPEIEEALLEQDLGSFVVDGEVVAFRGATTSFERLQGRMQVRDRQEAKRSDVAVWYYLFDLLHIGGHDVTRLALRRRKHLLRRAFDFEGRLRFTAHRNERGEAYLAHACEKGWEGLIAKRARAPYVHHRSRDWLKLKCAHGQELVIGGFTEPKGSRHAFGALLVGHYEDGELRYAGRVGTGFDEETLTRLGARLSRRRRETSPFADDVGSRAGVHFVTPDLVGAFGFTQWTREGRLRHPRFLGLRRDKRPEDVHRERPTPSGRARGEGAGR